MLPLALSLIVFFVGAVAATAGDYDITISEAEQKPYELGGKLEFGYLQHWLDNEAARYRLNYYNQDPGDYTQQGWALAELRGQYRLGNAQVKVLTHHQLTETEQTEEWLNKVYEAYVAVAPSPHLTVEAGKKAVLWGKGYAWNPAGFINRPKDPDDPELNLEGRTVVGAEFIKSFTSGKVQNLGLTAFVLPVIEDWANKELGNDGDFAYAAKFYLLWQDTDIDLIYSGGDTQPQSLGFDFAKNLAENIEVHGELAWQNDVRRTVLDAGGRATTFDKDTWSGLAGIRYLNAYDTTFIAEYYRNGSGYDRSQVSDFFAYQQTAYNQWWATGNAAVMQRANRATSPYYQQRNFGKDYGYLKISQKEPFDILYLTPWVAVMVNLQDVSANIQPGVTWAPVTNLELMARVGVAIGPSGTEFGEKQDDIRPEMRATWYF